MIIAAQCCNISCKNLLEFFSVFGVMSESTILPLPRGGHFWAFLGFSVYVMIHGGYHRLPLLLFLGGRGFTLGACEWPQSWGVPEESTHPRVCPLGAEVRCLNNSQEGKVREKPPSYESYSSIIVVGERERERRHLQFLQKTTA
jgi:hypothetical protein